MTTCQKYEDRLEALHDGELAGFARWRVARHVAACTQCRTELDELQEVARLVREGERESTPPVDLWASIAARLPALDAELGRRATSAAPQRSARTGWRTWVGPFPVGVGGLAAASVAVVLWLRAPDVLVADNVVEELDAMGNPVAVLPSDDKSTIIWVLDPKPVASAKESRGGSL
jgi:anti-sigma factor RsiW